jgi:hypothetical protein
MKNNIEFDAIMDEFKELMEEVEDGYGWIDIEYCRDQFPYSFFHNILAEAVIRNMIKLVRGDIDHHGEFVANHKGRDFVIYPNL